MRIANIKSAGVICVVADGFNFFFVVLEIVEYFKRSSHASHQLRMTQNK